MSKALELQWCGCLLRQAINSSLWPRHVLSCFLEQARKSDWAPDVLSAEVVVLRRLGVIGRVLFW